MATGASIYADPAQQFEVTPQALSGADPINAGGPPPINALSLPSVPTSATMAGQIDPGAVTISSPSQLLYGNQPQQQPQSRTPSPTTTPPPITSTIPVGTKPAAIAGSDVTAPQTFNTSAPYSRNWFISRIPYGEATPDGRMSSAGAYGQYQVTKGTYLSPGYGVTPGDPDLANSMTARNEVGREYAGAMYDKYGPAMGAAAYNIGPAAVDQAIAEYGDPRKGQISMDDWLNRFTNDHPGFKGYLNRMAGGQFSLPGQTPASQTDVAGAVDPGQTPNPLALQPVTSLSRADEQAQMKKYWAATAMASLLPQGFAYHPIDFNPFKAAYQRGQTRVDRYTAQGFATPRVVLGSGQGPSVTAISPSGVTPVTLRRRSS